MRRKEREVDFGWDALMRFGGRGGHQVETQSMCCSWNSIQKNWTERRWRLLIKSGCDGKNKGGVAVAAQQIKWQCQSKRVGASQLGRIWQGAGTEGSLYWNLSWSQFQKKSARSVTFPNEENSNRGMDCMQWWIANSTLLLMNDKYFYVLEHSHDRIGCRHGSSFDGHSCETEQRRVVRGRHANRGCCQWPSLSTLSAFDGCSVLILLLLALTDWHIPLSINWREEKEERNSFLPDLL